MIKISKILYQDKFVELYDDKLVIKTYYFPIATNKNISINDIRCIYYQKQDTIFCSKGWGMASTVWFACDMKRQLPSTKTDFYNVVLDIGTFIKQGFTVVDIHKFLKALRSLTNAPCEYRFPDAFEKREKVVIQNGNEVLEEEKVEKAIVNEKEEKSSKTTVILDKYGPPPSYDEAVGTSKTSME